MSSPPAHLSQRTLAPGALLALVVTTGAVFALAVILVLGPAGPARLWLGGDGHAVNLQPGTAAQGGAAGALTAPGSPLGLPADAGTADHKRVAATPRTTVRLRSHTRVQRHTARTPTASRPAQPVPSGTSPRTPAKPVSAPPATTPRPASTPAPSSGVVKTREPAHQTDPAPAVHRQRVASPPAAATPAPVAPVEKSPDHPRAQPDTSVGTDDGTLHRVPPPPGA
jgi:hypothetical protein